MKLSVAVDEKWGIGYNNELLFRIPEDLAILKERTLDKVVVMGHNTLKSLPKSAPLKDRTNIILSSNVLLKIDGAIVCNSIEHLFHILKGYYDDEVYVLGGYSVYKELIDYCDEAFVTKILATFTADRFFLDIDKDVNWKLEETSEKREYKGVEYCYCRYLNNNPKEY